MIIAPPLRTARAEKSPPHTQIYTLQYQSISGAQETAKPTYYKAHTDTHMSCIDPLKCSGVRWLHY